LLNVTDLWELLPFVVLTIS